MRTSLGDHLVALRRPAALAALAAAGGGVVAAMAPRLPLWRLTARVQALDTVGRQQVATLPGEATSDLAWAVAAVGVVVVVLAALVAVDRPPPAAERLLVGGGLLVVAVTAVLLGTRPAPTAFGHDAAAAELVSGAAPLPTGVDIDLWVQPAAGLWALLAAGVVVVAGTLVALRHG